MTLTRRNGGLVALGQNEAVRILLAKSDHELQHSSVRSSRQPGWFARFMRSFIAFAQAALQLSR
ncbi:MAG TPA: hypothetical protein VKW78_06360 [Terriglobales bacterium]|nr:hypothetical protein [Terriglobales bacterium]